MSLMWMAVGAGIGGLNAILGNKAQAEAQREQINLNRLSAYYSYKATEDSVNVMKALNREATQNAMGEVLRASAENKRQTKQQVEKASGALSAQQEGVTSGNTKGRQMASLLIQGNKAVDNVDDTKKSAINQLITTQDQRTNELNNGLLQAYQQMSAVLANEGPSSVGNANRVVSGLFGGAMTGLSIGNAFTSSTSTILPKGTKGKNPTSISTGINFGTDEFYQGIKLPKLF